MSCSRSLARAALAIDKNAASTLTSSFAEVSKYGMLPLEAHQSLAFFSDTCTGINQIKQEKRTQKHVPDRNFSRLTTRLFPPSISILFPSKINGNVLGSAGLAWDIIRMVTMLTMKQFKNASARTSMKATNKARSQERGRTQDTCLRNSSCQLSRVSKDFITLTS